MNSKQISCFLEAARCGSFTTAAKRLYISQPAFSRNISQLEEELGLALFRRNSFHGIDLTESGSIMAEAFAATQAEIDAAIGRARELERQRHVRLSLGLLEGQLLDDGLSDIFSRLRITYPNLSVSIVRDTYSALMNALSAGEIDLVCMPDWQLRGVAGLEVVPHALLESILVAPKRLVSAPEPRTYSMAEFAGLTFVSVDVEGHEAIAALLDDLFASVGISPKVVLAKSLREQIEMVEMGDGAILINPYNYICYSPNVCCFKVAELLPQPFSLAWRKDRMPESVTLLCPFLENPCKS